MQNYGIATLLEDLPVGYEFTPDNIPLHLTQVDSFAIGLGSDALASRLHEQLKDFPSFELVAVKDEIFGPNKDIPVTTFEITPTLKRFHKLIMDLLDKEGAVLKNPQYHNEGFGPHVTIQGAKRIPIGGSIAIKDVCIATKLSEAEDAPHKILAIIPLS